MKHDYQKNWNFKKAPNGPLIHYIDTFACRMAEQGYCRRHIGNKLQTVAKFSSWLNTKKIPVNDVTQKHVVQFLRAEDHHKASNAGKFSTLRDLIVFLQQSGAVTNDAIPVNRTYVQQVVYLFGRHLIEDKHLSNKTVIQYSPFIECFLTARFGSTSVILSDLSGKNVIDFIQHEAARLSVARAKVATNALRAFLRFGVYLGDINADLIASVPTVASWSMTGIPRAISQQHIQAVLASCDRNTAIGKRDFAIFMLLVHLGLRSGEVVALTLDSIDWECGNISIEGKCSKTTRLPIPEEVGHAISDYLKHGRPNSNVRALFLRALAPIKGFGAQNTIGTIVRAAVTRAGVKPPSHGAHQFRHAFATNMLRKGASLTEIGYLLRHKHPKTTNIYAKVDLDSLRSLSLAWPGGVQ
jgi:site-specific recombinase XerD